MHPDTVQDQVLTVQVPGSSWFLSPFIKEAMQELKLPSQASLTGKSSGTRPPWSPGDVRYLT